VLEIFMSCSCNLFGSCRDTIYRYFHQSFEQLPQEDQMKIPDFPNELNEVSESKIAIKKYIPEKISSFTQILNSYNIQPGKAFALGCRTPDFTATLLSKDWKVTVVEWNPETLGTYEKFIEGHLNGKVIDELTNQEWTKKKVNELAKQKVKKFTQKKTEELDCQKTEELDQEEIKKLAKKKN